LCSRFEIYDFNNAVTLKTGLGARQDHGKCHHSITMGISHRFRNIRRFESKIVNYPTPVVCAPTDGVLEIGYRREGSKKARMMGLPDGPRSFKIDSAV